MKQDIIKWDTIKQDNIEEVRIEFGGGERRKAESRTMTAFVVR